MSGTLARALKQTKAFASAEEEVLLGLQVAAARVMEPWAAYLKSTAQITASQYNVLRILRGSHPVRVTCGEIGERMLARDPDVTRLVDRLARRGLVERLRSRHDRRVVQVGISPKGLELLTSLDAAVEKLPKAMLGHLPAVKLRQLGSLIDAVLSHRGAFP
jgi:DNA-binding MarR family transcriptional regulator